MVDSIDGVALWRVSVGADTRLARGSVTGGPAEVLVERSLDQLLADGGDALARALGWTVRRSRPR